MNLVDILKNVPEGTKLYCTLFGECTFTKITDDIKYPIQVSKKNGINESLTEDGKYYFDYEGECVLFPSKENKDWNKFKVEKSYKFEPYDKVLVRDSKDNDWACDYFSHMCRQKYICSGDTIWNYCIPYNGETKHLVGTNKTI